MVNGDHITEELSNLTSATTTFMSRIFIYSFVFLCMWVALNILLAVVGEGYNHALERIKDLAHSEEEAMGCLHLDEEDMLEEEEIDT